MSLSKLNWTLILGGLALCQAIVGCSSSSSDDPGRTVFESCSEAASVSVRDCIGAVSAAWVSCYQDDGAPCASDNAGIAAALATLATDVTASCEDRDFGLLSVDALVGRLQNSCRSEADSIAWRTFGGPQGAVWPGASGGERSCLLGAHQAVATMVDGALEAIGGCLTGESCDASAVEAQRASLASTALGEVEAACADITLSEVIAVSPQVYVDRAAHQIDCITATSHADTSPLTLGCGPTNTDFEPTRGEWVQIAVDGDKWGTMCGDGSAYAFQVKLAPEGAPLDRVLVGLQGGGVCALAADCVPRFEGRLDGDNNLFNAMDDEPLSVGIASSDPDISPFHDWTQVYLPYCNQDVFAGGGVVEDLGSLQLPRYGAQNMRAAVQMVRDVIWKEMDAAEGPGFRPDELIALFGGWSAGGYGALYNYHWFLDDLQWPRTSAFPDAGGALDNEETFGVALLGALKIPDTGWAALKNLPPYCFEGDCAIGPVIYNALSPRLKQVPEQQMLILSNPYDDTQRRDAFFVDVGEPALGDEFWRAKWLNTMREEYCNTKDLNGINYYYTTVSSESLHVVTLREELWTGSVDGEVMSDWFWRAVTDADTIESRVEEGDFTEVFPGVNPYPCEVAP